MNIGDIWRGRASWELAKKEMGAARAARKKMSTGNDVFGVL